LESKSVELLTLWLDQAISDERSDETFPPQSSRSPRLPSNDLVDRIYRAKELLSQQLDNPPSLMTLARQVGLNDCTLKRGFKQLLGVTAFAYLHHCRMEQARSLLMENQQSVMAIAQAVGYTNHSAFSAAFRKKFGISPRAMQGQSRR
jgi:AraC-like DNA-binding protein